MSYDLRWLGQLVEGVTHERGVVEIHFGVQRVPLFRAHLLSELSELHNVSFKIHSLH